MSYEVNNAYVKYFDDQVKLVYQGMGNQLRNTVRTKTALIGNQAQFVVYGKGNATQRMYSSPVQPMNPTVDTPTLTVSDWVAGDYTDIFQQSKINYDEIDELAKVAGAAIGRRFDQLIINDGLVASGTSNVIADGGDNLTFDKVLQVVEYFDDIGVPQSDRYIAISASQQRSLMESEQMTNNFYVKNMILQNGSINNQNILGLNFIVIPTTPVGIEVYGLPLNGNIRSCFAWHKQAVGFAIGDALDENTQINYIPQLLSWLAVCVLSAGAIAIDNTGIVEIECDQAAA